MLRNVTRSHFSVDSGSKNDVIKIAVLIAVGSQSITDDVLQKIKKMEEAVHFLYIVGIEENRNQISLLKRQQGVESLRIYSVFLY